MKIGILAAFHSCADDIDEILSPFVGDDRFVISASCVQFSEFADPPDEKTIEKIKATPSIEYCVMSAIPMSEADARSAVLNYLKFAGCDYIWILDGDEFYTKSQVNEIVEYVKKEDDGHCFFSVNFKNYVLDGKAWVDGFCPPRIFNTEIEFGIKGFYWDNDVCYNSGVSYKSLDNKIIPKSIAHVRHMTWLHSNGKKKVEYQLKHFGHCSYKWDDDNGKLVIDESFYHSRGMTPPELKYD